MQILAVEGVKFDGGERRDFNQLIVCWSMSFWDEQIDQNMT